MSLGMIQKTLKAETLGAAKVAVDQMLKRGKGTPQLAGVGMGSVAGPLVGAIAEIAASQAIKRTERGKTPAQQGSVRGPRPKGSSPQVAISAPAAVRISPPKIGADDLKAHKMSWVAGSIYVGLDNTLGRSQQVYFRCAGENSTIVPQNGTANTGSDLKQAVGCVPVSAGDFRVGTPYGAHINQLYARRRVETVRVRFVPLLPNTARDMMIAVAPSRADWSIGAADSTAGTPGAPSNPLTTVLSMAGVRTAAIWEECVLDLTPSIAGGTGPRQNEFGSTQGATNTSLVSEQPFNTIGRVPCGFAISGNVNDASLNNTATHLVVVEQTTSYLDWVGAGLTGLPTLRPVPQVKNTGDDTKQSPPTVSNPSTQQIPAAGTGSLIGQYFPPPAGAAPDPTKGVPVKPKTS